MSTESKPMDAKRLEEVALYLFPQAGRGWKAKVAAEVKTHVTTVRRWVNANEVPPVYELLLECLAARKKDLLTMNEKGQQNG